MTWTSDELTRLAVAEELEMAWLGPFSAGTLHGTALLAHRIFAALTVGAVLLVAALLIALIVRPRKTPEIEGRLARRPARRHYCCRGALS
jgi:hypothetical protein